VILYLDTSALVKLYFEEIGSAEVRKRVGSAAFVATSRVAYVETLSGLARKTREGTVSSTDRSRALKVFHQDWKQFFVVEVSDPVCRRAGELVNAHPLRSLDAIHLASALLVRERTEAVVEFAAFDRRLSHAAASEGLVCNL
jgi:predicted nucleic acid-binding protein